MAAFIDDHRTEYGVESICRVLPIAPSTYYAFKAVEADPSRASVRVQRDELLKPDIWRVFRQNFGVYGARKVWLQLNREGTRVARCTVARLMQDMGLRGAIRGRTFKVTTHAAEGVERPLDLVDRDFTASRPNELWVSDLTYVRLGSSFCYVAFIIDVFARMIVGWQISRSLRSELALDALEQAITERLEEDGDSLVHHSDRGGQGGFHRSSQHRERVTCDDDWEETTFGPGWPEEAALAGEAFGCTSSGAAAVLGGHRDRGFERGSRKGVWVISCRRCTLVPGGRRNATISRFSILAGAIGALPMLRREGRSGALTSAGPWRKRDRSAS